MNTVEALNIAIKNRRAIYTSMFSAERVDDLIIEKMLENGNWAPTHKKTEPWRFNVYCDNGLKKLAKFQSELYKQKAIETDSFNQMNFEKLASKPLECSHIISIGMKRHLIVPEIEEICSVATAVQNMWLTASAYGIGCYWSTGGVTFYEEAKSFFNLEPEDKLLGFLFIGVSKAESWPTGNRKSINDKVNWIRK